MSTALMEIVGLLQCP